MTLAWPTKMHHVTEIPAERPHEGGPPQGEQILRVRAVTPLRDVTIRGLRLDASGGTHAVGLRIDRAIGVKLLDCSAVGFSRSAFELHGCIDIQVDGMRIDGECNNGLWLSSTCDTKITRFTTSPTGARYHANGVVRHAIRWANQATKTVLDGFSIRHMCAGLGLVSQRDTVIANGIIDDLDIREKMIRDSLEHVGIGIDCGDIDLTLANWCDGLVISNVQVSNCRGNPAQGFMQTLTWEQPQTYSVFLHDTSGIDISNLQVRNDGVSVFTNVEGDDDYFMIGIGIQDIQGYAVGVSVKGCQWGVCYNGAQRFTMRDLEVRGPPGGGGANATVGLFIDRGAQSGQEFTIDGAAIQGQVLFGVNFVWPGADDIMLRDINWDGVRFEGPMRAVRNTSGSTRQVGDVGVMSALRDMAMPGSDGAPGGYVWGTQTPNNSYGFSAPANTYCESVNVNGALTIGQLLETSNGQPYAKVASSPTIAGTIGRANAAKSAGIGLLTRMGPA